MRRACSALDGAMRLEEEVERLLICDHALHQETWLEVPIWHVCEPVAVDGEGVGVGIFLLHGVEASMMTFAADNESEVQLLFGKFVVGCLDSCDLFFQALRKLRL